MLIACGAYDVKSGPPPAWDGDTIFQYCTFTGLSIDGHSVDGALSARQFRLIMPCALR